MTICYRWIEGGSGFIRLVPAGPDDRPILPDRPLRLKVERVCVGTGAVRLGETQVAAGLLIQGALAHGQGTLQGSELVTLAISGCEAVTHFTEQEKPAIGLSVVVNRGKSEFTLAGLVDVLLEDPEVQGRLHVLEPASRELLADTLAPPLGRLAALLAFIGREELRPTNLETVLREHQVAGGVQRPRTHPGAPPRGGLVVVSSGQGKTELPNIQAGALKVLGSNFTLYHGVQAVEFFETYPYFAISYAPAD